MSIETFIQPYLVLSENGNWQNRAETTPLIHRAKLSFRLNSKILNDSQIKGRLSIDIAEKEFSDFIKNAYVSIEPIEQFSIKAGKFKTPFGSHFLISSKDLKTIYRSHTTKHLKDELNIAGYNYGIAIYGKFNDMIKYEAGVFKFINNDIPGFHIKDIFDYPVLSLEFNPLENISISYKSTLPQTGTVSENGEVLYKRFLFHDILVTFKSPNKLYETFFNTFIGVDTSEVKDAQVFFRGYEENVAFSLFSNHIFNWKIKSNYTFSLATGFEYLNGLNWIGEDQYENRSYYFALSENLQIKYKNKFFLQFSFDNKLDNKFKSINESRFAVQATYCDQFNLSKKK